MDGAAASILPGRHLAVAVTAGAHTVRFRYAPPGLVEGLALGGVAAAVAPPRAPGVAAARDAGGRRASARSVAAAPIPHSARAIGHQRGR